MRKKNLRGLIVSTWWFDQLLQYVRHFQDLLISLNGSLDECSPPRSQISLDDRPNLNLAAASAPAPSLLSCKMVVFNFLVAKKVKSLYRSLASNFTTAQP